MFLVVGSRVPVNLFAGETLMMSVHPRTLLSIAALAVLAACSDNTIPTSAVAPAGALSNDATNGMSMRFLHARVCPAAPIGAASCHSLVRIDNSGAPLATSAPAGYNPVDLVSAYGLPTSTTNATIAIVDAYDDPNAASDLAVYRAQFRLPACGTGCFTKVDQTGGTAYPRSDAGWAEEISLDLDMASAICPSCKILLVEAKSNSFANLAAAVDEAARLGATVISNSYGGSEYSGEVSDQNHFNHPGIAITVSSGDNGFGVEFPAASQYVTAVGGTTLRKAMNSRGWTETVWSGAGSGCSKYITKPTWQTDSGCFMRTVADVAAIADPNTGVSVYDTFRIHPSGWLVFGGTSVASPIIASVYALAGNAATVNYGSYPYANTPSLNDVTSGTNGSCGGTYLCTGLAGFDGPTGNGTPNGTGAF
jgi:subtilase family serine protease